MLQSVIDDVGKLGPFFVTVAVFWANRKQTTWTNALSRRSADVEDQKLRLSLLDRRIVAIEAIRTANQDFVTNGGGSPEIIQHVYQALRIAELVFDDEEEAAISLCLRNLVAWQAHDQARRRWRDEDDQKLQEAVDAMMATEVAILAQLETLRRSLRAAAKVRQVPAVVD